MKKVSTKNKMKGLFGLFAIFTMAIGVGVNLTPQTSGKLLAAEQYSKSYNKAQIGSLLSGSYSSESAYWKVPATAGNSATLTIPIVDGPLYPTTNITITLSVATYGTGNNPTSSNTTIKAVGNEAGSSWTSSSVSGTYPDSSTYKTLTLTMTNPVSSVEIGAIKLTLGVNSGVKILRLQTMTVSFSHEVEVENPFGTLTSIAIKTPATKLSFQAGESFSSAGLVLTATDDSAEPVTKSVNAGFTTDFDGIIFNNSHAGTQEVKVSYIEGDVEVYAYYDIVVLSGPVHQSTLVGMDWTGKTAGSVYPDVVLTDSSTDAWRLSSTEHYQSGGTMTVLGDYGGSGNGAWNKFSTSNYYKNIASVMASNSYGFAMYTQNFAVKGLLSAEFEWTKVSPDSGLTGNVYILGSKNGGLTWDILKQSGLASTGTLSISWAGSNYDVSDEVLVALAYTSSLNNGQIRNVGMKLYGDSKIAAKWALQTIEINGPEEMLINTSGNFTKNITIGETPINSDVIWSSTNTSVVTINSTTGAVTAVAVGNSTIKATAQDGHGTFASKDVIVVATLPVLDSITAALVDPSKQFYSGDVIVIEDIIVTAHYTEGKPSAIVSGATITSGATLSIGSNSITISYNEFGTPKTTTVTISAVAAPNLTKATLKHSVTTSSNLVAGSNNATTVGLDSTIFNVVADKGDASQQNNVGINKDGTTRLYYFSSGVGNILTVSVFPNNMIRKVVFNFGSTVAKAKIIVGATEKYNNTPTTNGSVTLDGLEATSFSIQNINTTSSQLYISSIDIYYEDLDITAVNNFVTNFMHPEIDADYKGINDLINGYHECTSLGYYSAAKAEFNNVLTPAQRALFVADTQYDAPRARLAAWAIANGDILNTTTKLLETPVNPSQNAFFNAMNDNNTIMLIVIVSLIGVSVLGGVFYFRKKEQN